MVRDLASEDNLINDPASYTTTSATFVTLKDFGDVVVPADGLVLVNFKQSQPVAQGTSRIRIKVGGVYAYATKHTVQGLITYSFICFLAAGTYAVIAEGRMGYISVTMSDFQLGFVNFTDLQGSALAVYAAGISKTTTARLTPVGNIKNTVYCVTVYATTAGGQTNCENSGESLTNGIQVLLDGVQKAWDERWQGDVNDMPAGGKCYVSASAGASHTVTVTKDNANTVVNISVAVCPWILPGTVFEPIDLDFSQGSTVYVVAEPLDANPTKFVGVGKEHAVTFGTSTDYYSSSSAVDIVSFSYTFEVAKVGECGVYASGFGGCISHVGLDAR
jgi:hypothetical protein